MEKIEFKLDGVSAISPARGSVLLVRSRSTDGQESDSVFCDHGILLGRSVWLFNCRTKTFLIDDQVPFDYATKVGVLTLAADRMVEVFELQTPPWYHRSEEDALRLARECRATVEETGLAEFFSLMAG
ncbi:MAG TPA: hypothetical protein VGW37_18465 [Terriglobia bacterium]|nr:hypothetical protein [Terriglobia bacterium]